MGLEVSGLLGLIILAFDIWALIHVIGSNSSVAAKVGWSLLILFLPVVGLLLWAFLGPRQTQALA
ncbi:MAG: PLD nuclease N-terminal domain-containing protein [Gammaproteobacteria bacterium]|nr:PLD nuclease N-terminal domain-containing protein [Gammaproteobacteria bacterium]